MGLWIVLLATVILLFVWLLLKQRVYSGILSDAHLMEVAEKFDSVRSFAYRLAEEPLEAAEINPDDPRVDITHSGVVVAYTVRRDGKRYLHHFSVSVAGGYTPPSVGGSLVIYLDSLLGRDPDTVEFGVSNGCVYHGEFAVDADEEQRVHAQPLALPDDIQATRQRCTNIWNHTPFRRVRVPAKG